MGLINIFRCRCISVKYQLSNFECFLYHTFSPKVTYNMGTAYLNHVDGGDSVNIKVCVNKYNKVLVFQRNVTESVSDFLNRFKVKFSLSLQKKMKKKHNHINDVEEVPDISANFFLNNKPVSEELTFTDIFDKGFNGDLKLRICDSDYDVILNSPEILKIDLVKKLYVGSVVMPEQYEAQFTDKNISDFIWYRSLNPNKFKFWNKCGEGFCYFPKEEDLNYYLKLMCIPKMGEKVGPMVEVISETPVENFSGLTEINKRQEYTRAKTKQNEFRIVSYNILADTYTQTKEGKTELFVYCNPAFIDFNYRKCLFNAELLAYKADILCLQEVDSKFYKSQDILFAELGYSCVYNEKEGSREGCLCVYDKNKFKLINASEHIFTKELLCNPLFEDLKLNINMKLMQRLLTISSLLQVVVLEWSFNQILIIGNTHFYFHPDADHIRLLQGVMTWKILQNIMNKYTQENDKKVSMLLCGDLNSTPECGFHQLLLTGCLESNHAAWKSKEDESIEGITIQDSLKMKSAYDNSRYTNFTPLFKGCLDYIYYQPNNIDFIQNVPIPSDEVLSQQSGIPSEFFPSDHIALIADFKINN